MTATYQPDPEAAPPAPYATAALSARDLGATIPMNYVTQPGVSLTAACFAHLEYEDNSFARCMSNLIVNGYRRFTLDLYWDDNRRVWSFCPVAVPTIDITMASVVNPGSARSAVVVSSNNSTSSPLSLNARQVSLTAIALPSGTSAAPSVSVSSPGLATSATTLPTTTVPQDTIVPNSAGTTELQLGPYRCTATIDTSILVSQLISYITSTQNNLEVNIMTLVFNLHAAASARNPTGPAPIPSNFPQSDHMLANIFLANLTNYIYTPTQLQADRSNLNSSFYKVMEVLRPAENYYSTSTDANDIVSTEDGWPSEGFLTFVSLKRLLLQFGTVDPQMSSYNPSNDAASIFPQDYLESRVADIIATDNGTLSSGCYLRANTAGVTTINSSWATTGNIDGFAYATSATSDLGPTINLSGNLTDCGISPILNVTLQNVTAHESYIPYRNFSLATVWSWAEDQPRTYNGSSDASENTLFRCAATSLLTGRWSVTDCSTRTYAACRGLNSPYNWTTTTYPITYSFASAACPSNYRFAAPRTALENSFLTEAIRARSAIDAGIDSMTNVFVDFNSIGTMGCWTTGGSTAPCPYGSTRDNVLTSREIVVPSVAAVIVLVISALVVFAKVAGSRKIQKRVSRRAVNGFVYEGVPS